MFSPTSNAQHCENKDNIVIIVIIVNIAVIIICS